MRSLSFAATLLGAVALTGCAATHRPSGLQVVAAESFWGSIAAQIAGNRATVQSIVSNPAVDPHGYEPTSSDARRTAVAKVAIVNGLGYDRWASQLLAADPSGERVVVDTGKVLGLSDGDNPHQWYSPASVRRVTDAIAVALTRADPKDAAYFAERKRAFESRSLARYDALRAEIRRRFAGVPVGYSESIFEPLGASLGLNLLTPPSFAKAVAEGGEVSAADKQTVEGQLLHRKLAVWVFNSQNVTPEIDQLNALARRAQIPVVTVTETLSPATATFQGWQAAQLESLLSALHRATGR